MFCVEFEAGTYVSSMTTGRDGSKAMIWEMVTFNADSTVPATIAAEKFAVTCCSSMTWALSSSVVDATVFAGVILKLTITEPLLTLAIAIRSGVMRNNMARLAMKLAA